LQFAADNSPMPLSSLTPAPQNVLEFYQHSLAQRGFQPDAAQQRVVEHLQEKFEQWQAYKQHRTGTLTRYLPRPELPRPPVAFRRAKRSRLSGRWARAEFLKTF
jgi:predicted ATPase